MPLNFRGEAMYGLLYRVVLRRVPAEAAHRAGFGLIRGTARVPGAAWALRRWLGPRDPVLRVRALGLDFPGPLGLAAGFDKDARGTAGLAALGFGFVEVGTVTARAQPGNPRPRMFRLTADRALVNRMGFNNEGAAAAAARLRGRTRSLVVGVNIGKTKVVPDDEAAADYAASARAVAGVADYVVVNVSSPNTPGLRDLQAADRLRPVLVAVREALDATAVRRVPLLVKIAPDLADADVDAVADLAVELGLDGVIATNTTISRAGLAQPGGRGRGRRGGRTVRAAAAGPGARGASPAAGPRRGPAGAHRGRRDRDPGGRLGPAAGRRHAGPGLHRVHLRRPAVAAARARRAGPTGAGGGIVLDRGRQLDGRSQLRGRLLLRADASGPPWRDGNLRYILIA